MLNNDQDGALRLGRQPIASNLRIKSRRPTINRSRDRISRTDRRAVDASTACQMTEPGEHVAVRGFAIATKNELRSMQRLTTTITGLPRLPPATLISNSAWPATSVTRLLSHIPQREGNRVF